MAKIVDAIKKNKVAVLVGGAVLIVAAGQLEFIPWTAAAALELIGTSVATASVVRGALKDAKQKEASGE